MLLSFSRVRSKNLEAIQKKSILVSTQWRLNLNAVQQRETWTRIGANIREGQTEFFSSQNLLQASGVQSPHQGRKRKKTEEQRVGHVGYLRHTLWVQLINLPVPLYWGTAKRLQASAISAKHWNGPLERGAGECFHVPFCKVCLPRFNSGGQGKVCYTALGTAF